MRRIYALFIIVVLNICFISQEALAADKSLEGNVTQSKGSITFYDKDNQKESPILKSQSSNSLPKTGESEGKRLYQIGFGLISLCVIYVLQNKFKIKKEIGEKNNEENSINDFSSRFKYFNNRWCKRWSCRFIS